MKYCSNCGKKIKVNSRFCEGCGRNISKKKEKSSQKQRPTFLNVWLAIMLIVNILGVIVLMFMSIANPTYLIYILFEVLILVCVLALYKWKILGFWGVVALAIISFILNTSKGQNVVFSFFSSAISVVILYLAMRSVWDYFE